jgi:hypothetical protein
MMVYNTRNYWVFGLYPLWDVESGGTEGQPRETITDVYWWILQTSGEAEHAWWISAKLPSSRASLSCWRGWYSCLWKGPFVGSQPRLLDVRRNFRRSRLVCSSVCGLPCGIRVIASRRACGMDTGQSSCSGGLASASDGEASWPAKRLLQRLACASEGEADWPNERWRSRLPAAGCRCCY